MNLSDNFKKFMGIEEKAPIKDKQSLLEGVLSAVIPSAEAGDVRQMLGVESHSGISMQSAAALRQLDKDLEGKKEVKPTVVEEKGKTQKEVFKGVFGEEAAARKKKQQEEEFKRLMQKRK